MQSVSARLDRSGRGQRHKPFYTGIRGTLSLLPNEIRQTVAEQLGDIRMTYRYPTHPRPLEETLSEQRLVRHDSVPLPKHRIIESKHAHRSALSAYALLLLLTFVVRTAHAEHVNDATSQNGANQSEQVR
jgi:hypothetical protein